MVNTIPTGLPAMESSGSRRGVRRCTGGAIRDATESPVDVNGMTNGGSDAGDGKDGVARNMLTPGFRTRLSRITGRTLASVGLLQSCDKRRFSASTPDAAPAGESAPGRWMPLEAQTLQQIIHLGLALDHVGIALGIDDRSRQALGFDNLCALLRG